MNCHLHIFVMSGELATGVDLYTLITWIQFSETGTELDIMEPCYEEPCMSGVTCSYCLVSRYEMFAYS